MNKFEELKSTRDGLDCLDDIYRYAREGWDAISEDDKARMKWYGLFVRKHTPGFMMMRLRIPGGVATSSQLRAMARIAEDFGRSELDLTTREQVQIRWLRIQDVPEIFARLADAGIDHRQTGMDNVRGVMGCPLAGTGAHEVLDASPAIYAFTARLVGNREFTNLPRKFNLTITGCPDNCIPAGSQDLALVPAVRETDEGPTAGFNVLAGGKMGSGGFTAARSLDIFVRPEHAAQLCAHAILIFRDHGKRESRGRARLAFLLDDWGAERFRSELEDRLGLDLERSGRDMRHSYEMDHLGVTPLGHPGLYAVGLAVPVGRLTAGQLTEAARLADEYGDGRVRLTAGQNMLLTGVRGTGLKWLFEEPLLAELRHDPVPAVRGTVACTGVGLCDLALTDTKVHALAVARRLERVLPETSRGGLSIHWSGCPAGCGNHHTADIGLQGGRARVGNEVIEVYQVFAGGSAGRHPRAATPILAQVPADQVPAIVQRLAAAHASGASVLEAGQALAVERGEETVADTALVA